MNRSLKLTVAGAALFAIYLAVAAATLGPDRPLRPFFDGTAPILPYRYVDPPEEFADINQPPEDGSSVFRYVERDVAEGGRQLIFEGGLFTTPDGQVSVSVPSEAFPVVEGQRGIEISVEHLSADAVPPAPEGLQIEGNAVRISSSLVPSGDPIEPNEIDCAAGGCINVVVRYPVAATQLFVSDREGTDWTELEAQNSAASLSLYAATETLGTFITTGIPAPHKGTTLTQIIAFVLGGLAVVGAVVLQRIRSKRAAAARKGSTGPGARGRSGQGRGSRGRTGHRPSPGGRSATRGKRRR